MVAPADGGERRMVAAFRSVGFLVFRDIWTRGKPDDFTRQAGSYESDPYQRQQPESMPAMKQTGVSLPEVATE